MVTVVGLDASIKKQVTCRNCSSVLEYLPKDIIEDARTDYTGDKDVYNIITCPSCSKSVTV